MIGTSKIEAQISRRAVETGNDTDAGDFVAFANDAGEYKFHPPMNVMRRQFCTMAKMFRFDDVREFALVVEGWTQKQRRDALDMFYKMRRDTVAKGEEVRLEDILGDYGANKDDDKSRGGGKEEEDSVQVEEDDSDEGDEL